MSLTTKDTKYTRGESGWFYERFSFVTFVYFVVEKSFPVNGDRAHFLLLESA
jgi:hypothetical protein